ncbi:MAG: hypothetical protein HQ498_12880 [Pseudohongiella sp.]|nr:hypothetical protein [Pseudohongiella sp.]
MNRIIALLISTLLPLVFSHHAVAQTQAYQLGMGLKVNDGFTLGGYFSTELVQGDKVKEFIVDDVAVMAYGSFDNNFSYLIELESIEAYAVNFESDTTASNLPPTIERLYGDYKFSDNVSIRIGKQITSIGYWNLQPINVLRETTSNPKYSYEMFPKFLTGVDIYGYTSFDDDLTYHVYLQGSKDIDEDNINIKIDSHTGFSLEKEINDKWKMGGSLGKFAEIDDTRTRYFQLNARMDDSRYSLISEAIINNQDVRGLGSVKSKAFYLQGEYRVKPRHAVITRAEYFTDGKTATQDKIAVIGYSYRPVFPVSLKIEYQWHSDSGDNRLLSSFSVLF